MNQLLKFALVLGLICFIATMVLAVTYEVTKPKIEEQQRLEEEAALKSILPEADSFTKKQAGKIDYFEAIKDGKLVGYCVKVTGQGYSGFINMIVGVNLNGAIEGVEILQQQETPGLGANIDQTRPGEKEPYFLRQFKGKKASDVYVKKNIDAITGATISSKAVTDSIRETVDKFMAEVKR